MSLPNLSTGRPKPVEGLSFPFREEEGRCLDKLSTNGKVERAVARLAETIRTRSRAFGHEVRIDAGGVLDRRDALALARPGLWSANRSARMVRAADGWLAVNLARAEDRALVPAWLGATGDASWPAVTAGVRPRPAAALVDQARLLGLPVARVGEAAAGALDVPLRRMGARGAPPRGLVDLSGLWAGPLAASLLAAAGMRATKVAAPGRPDPTRGAFDARLNGAKARKTMALDDPALRAMILDAGLLVTSARARAFVGSALDPAALFAARPGLVWVAVTGHGWASGRVAFGDDAAAAGGLVRRTPGGAPRFVGDALADPLTGLAAAAGALRAIGEGGGAMVDAAMAQVAAGAAA